MLIDHCRDTEEFKQLYKSRSMPIQYDFEWLLNNPNLFCFYDENNGNLKGYITLQIEDGELTLSGASVRKNFKNNIDAVKKVCSVLKEDVFAYSSLKEAGIVLKKCGFKKVYTDNNNITKWRFEYGK